MSTGLLLLRIVVAMFLIGHGTQKLAGWFGGYGLAGTGGFMESLGYRPGRLMAFLAGAGETFGGVLLLMGMLTPIGSIAVAATMLNAVVAAHWGKGAWATNGGWELPVTFGTVAIALAFTGPGEFSVDRTLDLDLAGTGWGAFALGATFVLGVLAAATRRTGVIDVTEADAADATETAHLDHTERV